MSEKKVQSYNFKRPDRISKNQIRSLHFVHDRFARNCSSSISAYLRTVVEITLENIVQTSYAEFLTTVSDPTCYAAMSLRPLDGVAALEMGPEVVFPLIDRLLGGAGKPLNSIRPMTEIEQGIIRSILKLIVDNLRESWKPVYAIDFLLTATETHPHMVQVTAPPEMIVHFQFQIRMREIISKMHLAIPTLALEPIIHIFDQEETTRKKVTQDDSLLHLLRSVPVKVSIETAETTFPLESLLSLKAGDTLVIDQKTDWPVLLKVAGKSKLHAMGQRDATRKFAVTGSVRPRKDNS
ncbi:MAG TPA: flagellar motor switch protein FliM [Terriglobia bacterium]|nr:flagellar motor switch protein FliM [Terriglobia bacterium]